MSNRQQGTAGGKVGHRRPIRVGIYPYTNCWPVFYHFDPSSLRAAVEPVRDMPAALNRRLAAGEIDVAAISSFAYGQHADRFCLLPGLSVSALGRVNSILLFLKSPLDQVLRGRIAVTTTSATSVALLRIIMEKFWGGSPTYEYAEPSLEHMLERADAALLIGDHAIRASWQPHGCRVLDLGEVWHLWTGHWMTFAVWAVRRETAETRPEEVAEIYSALLASKERSLRDPVPLVERAVAEIGGEAAYWHGYFANLCYDFGQAQMKGLKLYFRFARELGLLDRDFDPEALADGMAVFKPGESRVNT